MIDPQKEMLAWAATLYARESAAAPLRVAPDAPYVTVRTASLPSTPFASASVEEIDPPDPPSTDDSGSPGSPVTAYSATVYYQSLTFTVSLTGSATPYTVGEEVTYQGSLNAGGNSYDISIAFDYASAYTNNNWTLVWHATTPGGALTDTCGMQTAYPPVVTGEYVGPISTAVVNAYTA